MTPNASSRNQAGCSFLEVRRKERNEVSALYQTLRTKLLQITTALKFRSPVDAPGRHWCQMRCLRVGESSSWGGSRIPLWEALRRSTLMWYQKMCLEFT